jgi:glycosyltransferase involved in cell wall biosynthesis
MPPQTIVILTARDEAERLGATLDALARAFPGAPVVVGDDASRDATAAVARSAGAHVVATRRPLGKGGAATLAARRALELGSPGTVYVLCDGDLGETALELESLARAVRNGGADLAVATFAQRAGGGFGLAVGFAGWAIRRLGGPPVRAPISGQRALSARALAEVLPFAARFGMEIGMTVDAARAGLRVVEVELALAHRATGRDWRGFVHRARQLADFLAVYLARLTSPATRRSARR